MQQLRVTFRNKSGDGSLSFCQLKLNLCLQQLLCLTFIFGLLASWKCGIQSVNGHCDRSFLEEFKKPCSNASNVGTSLLYHVLWFPLTGGTLQCAISMWLLCFLHLLSPCSAAREKQSKQTHETEFNPSDRFRLTNSVSSGICLFWICGLIDFLLFPASLRDDVCLTGSYVIWQQGREHTSQYLYLQVPAWFSGSSDLCSDGLSWWLSALLASLDCSWELLLV